MRALILVDLQNDFMPGGALAVGEGDRTVPVANRLMPRFALTVAGQDWHPEEHGSFVTRHPGNEVGDIIDLNGLEQIVWPVHCVRDTAGADFHRDLNREGITRIFRKGTDPAIDSYSTFFDNGHRRATGLGDFLRDRGVTRVFLMGLATDYCVKYSALDARQLGFETTVVLDGCRGVELKPGDVRGAIEEMKRAGVAFVESSQVPGE
jgi:nicotinamidase/pyrazinamidase